VARGSEAWAPQSLMRVPRGLTRVAADAADSLGTHTCAAPCVRLLTAAQLNARSVRRRVPLEFYMRLPIGGLLFVIGTLSTHQLGAQPPARDSLPAHYSLLSQRGSVRILRYLAGPGDKTAMHAHPPHFAYVVRGGQLRFTYPNGQSRDVPLVAGQQFEIPRPLSHAIEVTGADSILVILVEDAPDSAKRPNEPRGSSNSPPNK
jgi:quercetin dioxygenase-like cupin family protein